MANFPIYSPWLPERTNFAMQHAKTDLLMLDVQLGSVCNAMCPRCDSACCDLDEPANLNLDALCSFAAEISARNLVLTKKSGTGFLPPGRNLGFICGLGEPTVAHNLVKFKEIVERTSEYGFSWSIFTNGISWDADLDDFMRKGYLSVLIQYNSNKPERVADMLGVGPKRAADHLKNRSHLQKVAKELNQWHYDTDKRLTNVAASIVPERDNLDELMELIQECVDYGIFPLIGELERAGHSNGEYYEQHKLHDHELRTLYQQIEQRFGISYEMPTCPATIGAIHINNRNIVTVDEFTGLSCGWFGLGDPKVHEIGSICEMSYIETVRAILEYRESRIPDVRRAINDYPDVVFGGCGGNARRLLLNYVSLYD